MINYSKITKGNPHQLPNIITISKRKYLSINLSFFLLLAQVSQQSKMVIPFIQKHFVIILKLVCITILLTFYYFYFFKDVIHDYSEGLTNFATKEESINR